MSSWRLMEYVPRHARQYSVTKINQRAAVMRYGEHGTGSSFHSKVPSTYS